MSGNTIIVNDSVGNGQPRAVTVFAPGELRVKEESSQQLIDTFDTAFDTTNIWLAAVTGNSGVAANWIGAAVTLGSGVANSGYSYIVSRNKFQPLAPAFNELGINVNVLYPFVTTARQFWGVGNIVAAPAIPTATQFMTDAFGFEIQEGSGKMYAVTYAAGARQVIQDLSAATGNGLQPTDASVHKYFITYRGDLAYWAIDNRDNIVATMPTGALGPNVNTLPVCVASVNTAAGTATATIQVNAVWMGDTGRNGMAMSDGQFGWRKQTMYPSGASYSGQVNSEGQRATYRYTTLGFTPVATPTAFAIIQGSATKVVRVKRIYVSGVATAAGNMPLIVTRRSTAGTLGSAVLTAITPGKHDTTDAAATAVISTVGTANYTTLGTAAGQLAASRIGLAAVGTGVADSPALYDFATRNDKPLILRGTTDFLTLEGNGAAVPAGGVLDIEIETEEDTY